MDIKNATRQILEDTLLFLSKLDNTLYTQPIPALFNSTLGKHTRHLIELYQCLLFRKHPCTVNYDVRERDIHLESNLETARAAILQLIAEIPKISLEENIHITSLLSSHKKIQTNITRELLYNYDHCVHHLAMMRVGVQLIRPSIELPNHIGVAVSTLKFQAEN